MQWRSLLASFKTKFINYNEATSYNQAKAKPGNLIGYKRWRVYIIILLNFSIRYVEKELPVLISCNKLNTNLKNGFWLNVLWFAPSWILAITIIIDVKIFSRYK